MKKLAVIALLLASTSFSYPADLTTPKKIEPPPFPADAPTKDTDFMEPYTHAHPVKLKNGRNNLVIWGEIKMGDSDYLQKAISGSKPIEQIIIIESPGGVMDEGLKMGRIIHNEKIATKIIGRCISACNFVFLGGIFRTIDKDGQFITHMFTNRLAPRFILKDIDDVEKKAEKQYGPDPGDTPAVAGTEAPKPPSASVLFPSLNQSDTVGKIILPPTLEGFGCDFEKMYGEKYDKNVVIPEEVKYETGAESIPQDAVPAKQVHLARLRAITMDYLCLEQSSAHSAAEIAMFLIEMRMSLRFLTTFSDIAHALARPLTTEELKDFNIVNTD
jgi:hypothetical protein